MPRRKSGGGKPPKPKVVEINATEGQGVTQNQGTSVWEGAPKTEDYILKDFAPKPGPWESGKQGKWEAGAAGKWQQGAEGQWKAGVDTRKTSGGGGGAAPRKITRIGAALKDPNLVGSRNRISYSDGSEEEGGFDGIEDGNAVATGFGGAGGTGTAAAAFSANKARALQVAEEETRSSRRIGLKKREGRRARVY